jgi:hypothetical protein
MNAMPWNTKAPIPAQIINPVASRIDAYARLNAEIAELEKQKDALGKEIKSLGEGTHEGSKCLAVVRDSFSERFDAKAFEADYPEVYAQYKRRADKPQRTLTIKALV